MLSCNRDKQNKDKKVNSSESETTIVKNKKTNECVVMSIKNMNNDDRN